MGTSEEANRFGQSIWYWVRTHRKLYALLIAILFVLDLTAIYFRFNSTTVFTGNSAVQEFRKKQAAADAAQTQAPPPSQAQAAAPSSPTAAPAAKTSKGGAQNEPAAQCDWVCPTSFTPPENGVYRYFQCGRTSGQCTGDAASEPAGSEKFGSENAPPREFPRQGQRIITTTGPQSWTNEHVYAEEHREQFDLSVDPSGVYNSRYKVDIKFGLVAGGSDIRQQPPFKLTQWPMKLGLTWSGSWTDPNRQGDADYNCKAIAKEELAIGGQKVKTWVAECRIHLKGPQINGDVLIRFWLSPELRNTAQELYDQTLSTPQGYYKGTWMATLSNLKPQR